MFSKKLLWGFAFIFIFLSVVALLTNMPQKKNVRVYKAIVQYFPYKIEKEFGGLDIVDKRTGEDLDIANAKVFIAFDEMLKEWGKKHLILDGKTLYVIDDSGKKIATIKLQNDKEIAWVRNFFGI